MSLEGAPSVEEMEIICHKIMADHEFAKQFAHVAHQGNMLFFLLPDGGSWAAREVRVDDRYVELGYPKADRWVRILIPKEQLL